MYRCMDGDLSARIPDRAYSPEANRIIYNSLSSSRNPFLIQTYLNI